MTTVNTEAAWESRGRAHAERTRAAKEVYDDERTARNDLIREADRLGWPPPKIAEWFQCSRTTVLDIVTGRKRAA